MRLQLFMQMAVTMDSKGFCILQFVIFLCGLTYSLGLLFKKHCVHVVKMQALWRTWVKVKLPSLALGTQPRCSPLPRRQPWHGKNGLHFQAVIPERVPAIATSGCVPEFLGYLTFIVLICSVSCLLFCLHTWMALWTSHSRRSHKGELLLWGSQWWKGELRRLPSKSKFQIGLHLWAELSERAGNEGQTESFCSVSLESLSPCVAGCTGLPFII